MNNEESTEKEKIMMQWIESGGLITKTLAAKISGLNESQIVRRVQSGELEEYKIKGIKNGFISYRDAVQLERKRAKKK